VALLVYIDTLICGPACTLPCFENVDADKDGGYGRDGHVAGTLLLLRVPLSRMMMMTTRQGL
jgi:hypothetical protein